MSESCGGDGSSCLVSLRGRLVTRLHERKVNSISYTHCTVRGSIGFDVAGVGVRCVSVRRIKRTFELVVLVLVLPLGQNPVRPQVCHAAPHFANQFESVCGEMSNRDDRQNGHTDVKMERRKNDMAISSTGAIAEYAHWMRLLIGADRL